MIPLRDQNPSGSVPFVVLLLIALNVLAFGYELNQGADLRGFVMTWGVVPERLALALEHGEGVTHSAVTLLTSMFLHGGWLHLVGNLWYLWIFGDNIEDRMGHVRFLGFYLLGGIVAATVHVALDPGSRVPTIGASGAIAAVLGAYALRFPRARVVTLIPVVFFFHVVTWPALVVLGLWFVLQFLSGALALSASVKSNVAFSAHVAGFVFGLLAFRLFERRD